MATKKLKQRQDLAVRCGYMKYKKNNNELVRQYQGGCSKRSLLSKERSAAMEKSNDME